MISSNQMHPQEKRLIGIDYGSKRVGVSISDPSRKFAFPLSVVENTPDLLEEIDKLAKENEIETIIMGESRNYKGEPNAIFADIEDFRERLEGRGYEVIFELEFMTSVQAERLQGKNDKIDASAAALILQSYLDKQNAI